MDITIISDSPLLEHDAMYMMQHYDKARQRLMEIRARDERRIKLAKESGLTPEELELLEQEVAEAKTREEKEDSKSPAVTAKTPSKMMSFDSPEDDDDLF